MDPADIPVMVFDVSKPIYKGVQKGKEAVADMKPWVVNLLVDWCDFDEVICTPENNGKSCIIIFSLSSSFGQNILVLLCHHFVSVIFCTCFSSKTFTFFLFFHLSHLGQCATEVVIG